MYPRPVLSSQDAASLRALIRSKKLPPPDKAMLLDWLAAAAVARKEDEVFDRVCFHDRVTLVSPVDSRDWFKLTVVLPEDHDAEAGRLSVTCDISRAVLGRRCGERVSWQAPPGFRHMSIASVAKFDAFVR